MMMMSSSSW